MLTCSLRIADHLIQPKPLQYMRNTASAITPSLLRPVSLERFSDELCHLLGALRVLARDQFAILYGVGRPLLLLEYLPPSAFSASSSRNGTSCDTITKSALDSPVLVGTALECWQL